MANLVLATAYVEMIPTARGINGTVQRQFAPAASIAERAGRDSGEAFTQQAEGRISAGASRIGAAVKGALALTAGVVAGAGAVGLKTAGQLEQAEISFTTMLGSGEKAQAFLADLSTFAAKTPFDLPGLNKSAGSLISAGIEANKVIPIMTSLGNATSGMGTGAEGVQRATIAIQQMNAAGKIGAEDLNQLRDAGVPVFDLLTAATGKTTAEIAEMAAKGKLGREELDQLMTALETGKGLERFNGLMEAQSQSLVGLASTFKDTFEVGLAQAIEPLIPLVKAGLGGATTFLADVALPRLEAGLGKTVAVAQDAYDILTGADYTGKAANFGIYEDSKLVDFLFDVREGLVQLRGGWNINQGMATQLLQPLEGLALVGHRLRTAWDESAGGFKAFGAAWRANDGDITSSGFPGFMERAAFFTRQVMDAVRGLDTSSLPAFFDSVAATGGTAAPLLADIGTSLAALWPAIREFAEQAPDLATGGLTLLAAGLGFLADHVDTIIEWMPLIVAGFVAWRVAMIALTAAQAIAVPIQIALNVSRIAAAKAEKGLAADLRHSVAALAGHTVATTTSTAATATGAAASTAAAGATQRVGMMARLAAAGQWLLNAAMSANPIGLIVVAIAGLVAGLVWFFTQTEIGQQIVATAWAGIQLAVGVVADWFQQHVMPAVKGALDVIGGAVTWLWDTIIKPYFGFIGTVLNGFGMLVGKIVEIAVKVIRYTLGATISWLWNNIVNPVFSWISEKIELAALGWQIILGKAKDFIDRTLGPVFTWLWKTIIQPAFDGIGTAVQHVWDKYLNPIFGFIGDAIEKDVPRAFDIGVKAVETAWNKLQDIAKKPVKFVVEKVLNEGLIANVNKIAKKVGVDPLPDVALPAGFRTGGYTGDGNPNHVAGVVHKRELVLPDHVTGKLSDEERHALVTGGLEAVRSLRGVQAAGASPTGAIPSLDTGVPGIIAHFGKNRAYIEDNAPGWQVPQAAAIINQMSGLRLEMARTGMPRIQTSLGLRGGTPSNVIAYAQSNQVRYGSQYEGQSPTWKRAVSVHELMHVLGHAHTSMPSIMQPVIGPHMLPTAYDVQQMQRLYGGSGTVPNGDTLDGKGLLDTILGPFKTLAGKLIDSIRKEFPGAGTFIDLAVGAGKAVLDNAVKFMTDSIGKLKDIAGDIWDGAKKLLGIPAMAPTLYDNGGLLQPGISVVENRTRRPEPILTGSQWDAFTEGGGDSQAPLVYVQNPFTGEYLLAQVEDIAVGATGEAIDSARTRSRRGGKYQGAAL